MPKEWADKYTGQFDSGWDEYREVVHQRQIDMGIIPAGTALSAHDPDVPAWESLSADAKRLSSRFMEVYAGFVDYTDHHFGRILDFLAEIGERDNTLVIVVSDNGASSEGGAVGSLNEMFFFNNAPESLADNLAMIDQLGGVETCNHYPWGWTNAGNTPFRRWKRETYRGGTTRPVHRVLAGADHRRRGAALAVRPRDRLRPDGPGRPRRAATGGDPWRAAGPDRGRQLRPHLRRRVPPRAGTRPSTSR